MNKMHTDTFFLFSKTVDGGEELVGRPSSGNVLYGSVQSHVQWKVSRGHNTQPYTLIHRHADIVSFSIHSIFT